MSLERKKVWVYLDPDMHRALANLATNDGVDLGAWAERVVIAAIERRHRQSILDSEATEHLGKSGKTPERPGK